MEFEIAVVLIILLIVFYDVFLYDYGTKKGWW